MTEITIEMQIQVAMLKGLAQIANGDVLPEDAPAFALDVIKNAETIRREGEPLHGIETSGMDHGERTGQPPGILYTLTITDEGDANEWRSDRVRSPEQVAWLHGIVTDAAASLASTSTLAGLN